MIVLNNVRSKSFLLLTAVILLLVFGGFFAYKIFSEKGSTGSNKAGTPGFDDNSFGQVNETTEMTGNKYVEYSPEVLDLNKDLRRILYFYANWCPTCRPADVNFKANESRIPEGVVLIRVNYNDSDTDSNEEKLATQYGITYQHTFVEIDEEGNELQKWNGGAIEELLKRI